MYIRYNKNNEVTDYSLSLIEGEDVVNLPDAPLRIDIRQPEKLMYRDGLFIKLDDQEMTLEQSKEYHRILDEESKNANLLEIKIGQTFNEMSLLYSKSTEYEQQKTVVRSMLDECANMALLTPYHPMLSTLISAMEKEFCGIEWANEWNLLYSYTTKYFTILGTIFDGVSEDGVSGAIGLDGCEEVIFDIATTDNALLVIKIKGATSAEPPDFSSPTSPENTWEYVSFTDISGESPSVGMTELPISGTDISTILRLDTSYLTYAAIEVASYSSGSATIKAISIASK